MNHLLQAKILGYVNHHLIMGHFFTLLSGGHTLFPARLASEFCHIL